MEGTKGTMLDRGLLDVGQEYSRTEIVRTNQGGIILESDWI